MIELNLAQQLIGALIGAATAILISMSLRLGKDSEDIDA